MSKSTSTARKQRRSYELWLKKTNPIAYREWKSESLKRGKFIHEQNVEAVNKSLEEQYEAHQGKIIERLKSEGKSQEEIDRHISIWVSTLKVWGSDERPMSWTEAEKQYDLENAKS